MLTTLVRKLFGGTPAPPPAASPAPRRRRAPVPAPATAPEPPLPPPPPASADAVHVHVGSALAVGTRQPLRARLLALLERGVTEIVLDFRDTVWVDASGLGMLVAVSKQARLRGARLVLEHLNGDLRNLVALTKLDTLFEIRRPGD